MVCKAFRFRIYPTKKHAEILAKQFGHTRFVYNHFLALREDAYKETGKGLSYQECAYQMKLLKTKAELSWLKEAHSQVLQQSLMHLDTAYENFFKGRAKHPRFKSKHDKQSICYPQGFKVENEHIYLPKVGWVKGVLHRPIEGTMKSCTVSKTKTGKYFVSIQCEVAIVSSKPVSGQVGIDLGLKDFATLSTGQKIEAPRYLRKSEKRLKRLHRGVSRKEKAGKNRKKANYQLSVQYEHVANQRKDFHHKESRKVVDLFGLIVFEDLNIAGMIKNHNLAKSIADVGWAQFVQFCSYKQLWSGGQVMKIDRWFASSKICSNCHYIHKELKLSDRKWICASCGVSHDRDYNAALNIVNKATLGARESNAWETCPPKPWRRQIREGVGRSAREAQVL